MKRTDLEKLNGLKIRNRLKDTGTPERYAGASSATRATGALPPLLQKLLKKPQDDQSGG